MVILQNISYIHPDKELLFDNIDLSIGERSGMALVGNNGAGKSTLLRIISGELPPAAGRMVVNAKLYYVKQIAGQYDHLTISQALGVEQKIQALKDILAGNVTGENLSLLGDDWAIEERCLAALDHWQLGFTTLSQRMASLSGGQQTRVMLAGILVHDPELILLDEPTNHLDIGGRELLYGLIRNSQATRIIVSHDRKLLQLPEKVYELSNRGITVYGGNYDFYLTQKQMESEAFNQTIKNKEKALRKARDRERETMERQQRLDMRGKQKQAKAGVARIMMKTMKNNAEKSTSKMKAVHAEKIDDISRELKSMRAALPDADRMKLDLEAADVHRRKVLLSASDVNYAYHNQPLWKDGISLEIMGSERIALQGPNGSGKTTLLRIILGELEPQQGSIYRAQLSSLYVDQNYSMVDKYTSVYEQVLTFNDLALQEHEVKSRLARFLFTKEDWDKPGGALSGGERMRLLLCCLTLKHERPDIIVLDEPTNNLDTQNTEILIGAVNEYNGALIVVSHDAYFLEQVGVQRCISL